MYSPNRKIVIVTRPTQVAALAAQFNTRSQAKFKIVQAKRALLEKVEAAPSAVLDQMAERVFEEIDAASQVYDRAVETLRGDLQFDDDLDAQVQVVDRAFLPNFLFGPDDVVVTVGQDGLVANTAKYAVGRPIIGVNPDPARIDGVLLPFHVDNAWQAVRDAIKGKAKLREVTLAEAVLSDQQRLLAFNDLFIGCRSHVSARYRLTFQGRQESQSSSGVLVSTGAGSTGWLSSVFNMTASVTGLSGAPSSLKPIRLNWEDPRLLFVVREPFISKQSSAGLTAGILKPKQTLLIESTMDANGVIFSDGIENDAIEFNAGSVATIRAARDKALLVVP